MKITLVGSTRFRKQYEELNRQLSTAGHVVYSVSSFMHAGDDITEVEKERLDLVHLQKIMESEAIVIVTDETGYYGESTKREILWAKMLGKKIHSSQFPTHISHLTSWFDERYPVNKT